MDKKKLNILICDDSLTSCVVLSTLIQQSFSAQVSMVIDPRVVFEKIKEQKTDLLFLDIEMPYRSGHEVMREVRAQYKLDDLPIIIISGKEGNKVRNKALAGGANDFINKPFDPEEVVVRTRNIVKMLEHHQALLRINQQLEQLVRQRTEDLDSANDALIYILARAGELRDDNTGQHVIRMGLYSKLLADKVGLPAEIVHMIEKTAPLHDLGKIGIPDRVLLKPGRLSSKERKVSNTHVALGATLLGENNSAVMQMARSIIVTHHEKWDGSGYGAGLAGETIPIEGRIVAIADVFDALTSVRSYKLAWPVDKAIRLIQSESGKAFDPNLVRVFNENIEEIRAIREKYSDQVIVEEPVI